VAHKDLGITGRPSLRQLRELRDQCSEWGIQIVHAHDASSQFVASMLRLVAPSLRVVMTFHRSLGFESAGWRNRLRNAVSLVLVDRVLTASDERRQHFLDENLIQPRKVATIPLGIDLGRFRPEATYRQEIRTELGMSDQENLIVAAGHFGEEKGIDLVLEAAALAINSAPDSPTRLVVMGTGSPERIELIHQLGRARLGDRVTFLGQRSDPERVFAAADLVVHTPRLEAFGLVVVQAMACGVPVVAARLGGLPEIVLDGVTGYLAEPTDPESAGRLIGRLLGDPVARATMGRAALERARQEYTPDRFALRHRELYRRLIRAD
jgi:glycosyltransferase involved in cell wall biosynthesis